MGDTDLRHLLEQPRIYADRHTDKFKVARWLTVDEAEILYGLIMSIDPEWYFECGTANGYSAWVASQALSEDSAIRTYDIVDRPKVWQGPFEVERAMIARVEPFHEGIARDTPCDRGMSVYFIDGDHTHDAVAQDWKAIYGQLQKGDMVIFHDVQTERGSQRHWNALRQNYKKECCCVEITTERGFGVFVMP